jgi:catalase-peroxidase
MSEAWMPSKVTSALAEQTDAESFKVLEPAAGSFRNYVCLGHEPAPPAALIDRASLLTLMAPETTVLVGGLRVLGANHGGSAHGVFTERPGALTADFFIHLLDIRTAWTPASQPKIFEGRDRATGEVRWTATAVDLTFGSNAQLRALAEVYASRDGEADFIRDFVNAWTKVMKLDRFDDAG